MMGRQTGDQSQLFYLFNLERRIPTGNLLRRINPVVTRILAELRDKLVAFYSDIGRPSIDPELMIRMLIVGYCYGIRSERRLCEEVDLHLAPSDVCSLQDSGLARWCSLSLSAWLPSAAPDHGRAAAADFFFANLGGGAAAAGLVGDGATGSTATTAGSRQHDDGLRTCARSKIPGWRVGALYPLARGCRAPRRIMAAPPRPISFLRIWVAAPLQLAWSVTELRGRRRRPPDRASMMMAFGRVLAPRFRAGALVLFIP